MRRLLAITLIVVGAGCLSWYAWQWHAAAEFQRRQNAALKGAIAQPPAAATAAKPARDAVAPHGVVGRLDIPRVHLSTVVVEGDDDAALKQAAGHLPDTALPWESGNSAIAAHRDTFFRPLKDIRPGDEIRLVSSRGEFAYRVKDTKITTPDDVGVLAPPGAGSELTLITCYPFYYVGSAPKRFVVRAVQLPARDKTD